MATELNGVNGSHGAEEEVSNLKGSQLVRTNGLPSFANGETSRPKYRFDRK